MKRSLLNFFLVSVFTLLGGVAFGQTAPNISYPGNTVTFTQGTTSSSPAPTNSGGTVPANIYGTVTTLAGSTTAATGRVNATGTSATFNTPYSVVGDNAGNLYVADAANNEIRKIVTSTGVVTLFAGSTAGTAGTANGVGTAATFNLPEGIAIDATGTNLYVSDEGSGYIRKIVISTATVSTIMTGLSGPRGLCLDAAGTNLYVADYGSSSIRKILLSGPTMTTYAGSTTQSGYTNGTLTAARFSSVSDVVFGADGNLYAADEVNNAIRKITTTAVTTFAGSTTGANGSTNGTGTGASFYYPLGIAVDGAGNFYVGDYLNDIVRMITPAGVVTTLSGTAGSAGETNGTLTTSLYNAPSHMFIDNNANMYLPDRLNNNIRKLVLGGFSISPTASIPAGLIFDATTGIISGNATTSGNVSGFTVTGYNYYGFSATPLTINVNPKAPANLTYSPAVNLTTSPMSFSQGTTGTYNATQTGGTLPASGAYSITNTTAGTPAQTGTTTAFAITGTPGLTFNPVNGQITGTPTGPYASQNFTVTATNVSGSASISFALVVYGPVATVTYNPTTYTLGQNVLISPIVPTSTTGTAFTATLPAGLSIDNTGTITGTPTTVSGAANYTINATNASNPNPGTAVLNITVVAKPTSVTYSPTVNSTTPMSFTQGTAGTYTATETGGTLPASGAYSITNNSTMTTQTGTTTAFAITGTPGLTFNPVNGTITGTPTGTYGPVSYTVTATNAAGSANTGAFNIVVYPVKPTITYSGSPYTFGQNVAITPFGPSSVTGSPTTFTSTPTLPAGLSIDNSGNISGTPTTVQSAATYTVNAYNANPTPGTYPISITVVAPPTSISYTPALSTNPASPTAFTQNTAITTETATVTGGTIPASGAFSLTNNATSTTVSGTGTVAVPGVPGLTFSYNNGQISGTPTSTLASSTSFTAKVTNAAGSATFTFYIIVYPPKPVIAYSPSSYTFGTGSTVSTNAPTSTGGAVVSYSIDPSTPLPMYLSLNTATGVISGSSAVAVTAATYKVNANNANPTAGSANVTITFVLKPNISYSPANPYTDGVYFSLSPSNMGGTVAASNNSYSGPNVIISGVTTPIGVAVDPSGNVYVVGKVGTTNEVTEYNSSGTISYPFTTLANPLGIAFDTNGNAYVLYTNRITEYTYSAGSFTASAISFTVTTGAQSIAIDNSNNIFVGNSTTNIIYKYTPAGGAGTTVVTGSGTYPISAGIAVDNQGDIYVVDNDGGSYIDEYVLSSGTRLSDVKIDNTSAGSGIALDASGNIYLANTSSLNVTKYSNDLSTTLFQTSGYYSAPRGVVTDSKGNFYVSDSSLGTVTEFSPLSGYYLTGTLPAGVSFDNSNGVISGTPTVPYGPTSLTVTAYNAGGGNSTTFTLTCVATAPVISYTPSSPSYPVNVAITPLLPTVSSSGGPVHSSTYGAGTKILTGLSSPYGMDFDTNGNLYVVNNGGTGVTEYNTSTGAVTTAFTAVTGAIGIAFDSGNNAYVLTTSTLYKYTYSGGVYTLSATTFSGLATPTGITIDASNTIYVGNNNGSTGTANKVSFIAKYTTSGGTPTTINTYSKRYPISTGTGIAVDGSGNIYVVDNYQGEIDEYVGGTLTYDYAVGTTTGLFVDASNNIYVSSGSTATVYDQNGNTLVSESGFTTADGIIADNKGNFFVSDFGANNVTEFSAQNYTLTIPGASTLPPGISFNTATGAFFGTPTAAYGPVTYTVTANGYAGTNSTPPTPVTITCYFSYDWVGTTSADWNTNTNWLSKVTPTNTSAVYIGVNYPFTNLPAVSTAAATAASVTFGNKGGVSGAAKLASLSLTSTYSLTVSGPINKQSDANSAAAYISTLSNTGTGTITATGLNVLDNPTATAAYTDGLSSSVTGLTINGNAAVTSTTSPFAPTLSLKFTGGTAAISGNATLTAGAPSASNLAFNISGGTVTVTGNAAATVTASTASTLAYNFTGGTTAVNGNVSLTSTASSASNNLSFNVNGGLAKVTGTLSTANGSGSTATYFVANGTLQLVNAAPLTNTLSTAGTNVLSFVNAGGTIEYSGAAQTVYTDAAIQGLTTGPSYQNIKFSGSGIKTPNGSATNNLFVAGNFTNTLANTTASNVALTGTIVNFNGAAQTLSDANAPVYSTISTTKTPSPFGTIFKNVTFSGSGTKTMSAGGFVVASTGLLIMSGSSTLAAGGFLTLNSDSLSTASVDVIPAGCSITGSVNVQRFITGGTGYRSYRLMSSPVYGSSQTNGSVTTNIYSLNYLMSGMYLRGTSGTGFDGMGNDNVFLYRENITPSNSSFTGGNYNGLNSMVTTYPTLSYNYPFDGAPNVPPATYGVPVGAGFLVYSRGDRKAASYATETAAGYAGPSAIITATGTLNQGSISPIDWYTPSSQYLGYTPTSPTSVQGFNLVGNPYASSIDWDTFGTGITATNVSNTVYELNPKTQNFDTYQAGTAGNGAFTGNGSHIVVSGQGIFVVAGSGANPQITFTEAAKTTTQVVNPTLMMATRGDVAQLNRMKADKNQHLRLELALDSVNAQDIYVAFATTAKTGYVFNEDAQYKQGTGKVSFSSYSSDNVQLAINRTVLSKSMVIRLNVGAVADGTYKLSMLDLANVPAKYDIWLKDAKLNDSVAMSAGASYSFSIALADTTTYGANRFSLIIKDDPALRIKLLDFAATKVAKTAEINWTVKNEGTNAVFVVERSTDKGATFDDIGTVASNGLGKYAFTDKNPVMPEDRYKLKLINADSTISYSKVATLTYSLNDGGVAKSRIIVFPNPATTTVNMAILQNTGILDGALNYLGESLINDQFQKPEVKAVKATYNIKVFNSLGSVVRDVTSKEPVWQTNVSSLLPGTYVIQVTNTTDNTSVGKSTFVKL